MDSHKMHQNKEPYNSMFQNVMIWTIVNYVTTAKNLFKSPNAH